ncbi:MAG TPA: class I SAM-dependent methyltransferase [Opitutaceae bacterium]|nr:class I SAM-dependent methyltransferase [Opitutaceae bacterium]HRE06445.1 class I SAM-dependent methyltransferase [Opitutaceae bacterium]
MSPAPAPASRVSLAPPSPARRLLHRLRHGGPAWLFSAVFNRLVPARPAVRGAVRDLSRTATVLEIGGPSAVFGAGQLLPVYAAAAKIDNVNFSSHTAWEAGLRDGGVFAPHPTLSPGRQYLREATSLSGLPDGSYDLVISSHCLEHVANPLAALAEWRRVVRPGGHLLLLLPDPRRTFDHRRPVTTLDHLRQDRNAARGEDDLTHLDEILRLHDLGRDPHAGSHDAFVARARLNPENRCLHHHVFDLDLMRAALSDTGWHPLALERARPLHLIALARNP